MSTLKVDTLDTPSGSGNITVDRPTILQAGDIITADILDANVTTAKIADSAVTGAKIAADMNPSLTSTGKALVLGF